MLSFDSVYTYEEMVADLKFIAMELADQAGDEGITVSDIRLRAVEEGVLTGQECQKDLSFLGYIPRYAGLVPTERKRTTPIKQSHRHQQRVYVRPRASDMPATV